MKLACVTGLLCLAAIASAQEIQYDYDRSANFGAYKTYQWAPAADPSANQLMDQNLKRAIDGQLALKGLQRVESGGDLIVSYQVRRDQEKEFNGFGSGPRFYGNARVTTSTIEIGNLGVDMYDAAKKQLVWRGTMSKQLDIKKDPDKNFENLQKATAKLFKNYPPGSGKN
jgi:hypothetical protein